jgi:hypothetical protein
VAEFSDELQAVAVDLPLVPSVVGQVGGHRFVNLKKERFSLKTIIIIFYMASNFYYLIFVLDSLNKRKFHKYTLVEPYFRCYLKGFLTAV